jgi:hypothetical protein
MRRALVGSDRLGSGCLVLRADTRENPGGKNGVMTGLVHPALETKFVIRVRIGLVHPALETETNRE